MGKYCRILPRVNDASASPTWCVNLVSSLIDGRILKYSGSLIICLSSFLLVLSSTELGEIFVDPVLLSDNLQSKNGANKLVFIM